ncbi:biliverdin-producing heme oxygenase [Algoriphagus sp. AGSA1]|uniref:biliverdin-producing heme oxygenase n=1 Tax=Algoriphagus sp. AGSA1 TaxID=2907213 RepID=UPI001F1CC3CC|nr:biliverdin-producing heme oxygenase [Algoriphagus sp. AGSA1]MCE7054496.1 biliverdin-producing heme oxygenase [Algoriphagus sp. AGSA1]
MRSAEALSIFSLRLKEATSTLHQELENLPVSKSILENTISSHEYLRYLDRMHDVVCEIENKLFPILQERGILLQDRKKTKWIEKDFIELEYKKNRANEVFIELNEDISTGYALGILYVIEGSTLGGRIISKHVQRTLGYTPDNGAAYFAGYGEDTGLFWKKFMTILGDFEKKNLAGDEIIEGAKYAFKAIGNHFRLKTEA